MARLLIAVLILVGVGALALAGVGLSGDPGTTSVRADTNWGAP